MKPRSKKDVLHLERLTTEKGMLFPDIHWLISLLQKEYCILESYIFCFWICSPLFVMSDETVKMTEFVLLNS